MTVKNILINDARSRKCPTTFSRNVLLPAAVITLSVLLSGCAELTRVDMATYEREYAALYPMGMDQAAAVRNIEAAGYSCIPPYKERPVMRDGVEVPVMRQDCSRASFELMCPQRRHVAFLFRTADKVVIKVERPLLEDQSCF